MDVLETFSWTGVVRTVSHLLLSVRLDRGSVKGVMALGVLMLIVEIREETQEIMEILETQEILEIMETQEIMETREIREEVEFVFWESVGVLGSLSRIGAEITAF